MGRGWVAVLLLLASRAWAEPPAIRALPPGAEVAAAASGGAFAVGTRFSAGALPCQLGAEIGAEVRARTAGRTTVRCGNNEVYVELPVVIAPVVVATDAPALPRGETTVVHVTVASVAELGDRLDVVAIGDIGLGEAHRTTGGLDVLVAVQPDARTAALSIESSGYELGRVDLPLGSPRAAETPPGSQPGWYALDLGGFVGGSFPPSDGTAGSAIGHPAVAGDAVTAGPLFGPRVGFFPLPRVGVEADAAFGAGGYVAREGHAALLDGRVQLAVRAVEDGALGLRLVGGAGFVAMLSESGTSHRGTEGEVHAGAAFTVEWRPDRWVRLQALDVITPALDGGYAHSLELQVGVTTRLGRRDHW